MGKNSDGSFPTYGEKPISPGLYLGLFHGRNCTRLEMEDWGFSGPAIGPLKWVHTTYACTVRIDFENSADAMLYFGTAQTQQFFDIRW